VIVTHKLGVSRRRYARNDPATPITNGFFEMHFNARGIGRRLTLCGSTLVSQWRQLANHGGRHCFNLEFVQGGAWGAVNETNPLIASERFQEYAVIAKPRKPFVRLRRAILAF
jgi:hypothetical protein